MVDIMQGLLESGELVLRGLVAVMALWTVVQAVHRSPTLLPAIGAAILAGAVIWLVSVRGMGFVEQRVDEDVRELCEGCDDGVAGRTGGR